MNTEITEAIAALEEDLADYVKLAELAKAGNLHAALQHHEAKQEHIRRQIEVLKVEAARAEKLAAEARSREGLEGPGRTREEMAANHRELQKVAPTPGDKFQLMFGMKQDRPGCGMVGEWVAVEDEMPDDEMTVLVWVEGLDGAALAYHDSEELERRGGKGNPQASGWMMAETTRVLVGVSHWCREVLPPVRIGREDLMSIEHPLPFADEESEALYDALCAGDLLSGLVVITGGMRSGKTMVARQIFRGRGFHDPAVLRCLSRRDQTLQSAHKVLENDFYVWVDDFRGRVGGEWAKRILQDVGSTGDPTAPHGHIIYGSCSKLAIICGNHVEVDADILPDVKMIRLKGWEGGNKNSLTHSV